VIRGSGYSDTRAGRVEWQAGDLFVLPYLGDASPSVCFDTSMNQCVRHHCDLEPTHGGCALYFVHDAPLLQYLGARPVDTRRFQPALYPGTAMKETVHGITRLDATGAVRNRRGILLSSPDSPQTKTLTPTLWSLLNSIDAGATQAPHRHNSVALDLAVSSGGKGDGGGEVYTLLGRGLNANGSIVEPLKVVWESGGVFVTPPGWWHSHHNEASDTAWVLPMQDAGLYTHQRTLDIRFQADEAARLKQGVNRGATQDAQAAGAAGAGSGDAASSSGAGGAGGSGCLAGPLVAGTLMFGHVA
jgi:gentisate 1,2-dioxygenase